MVVRVNQRPSHQRSKTMDGNPHQFDANIALLGAENVGKSALTVRFLTRRFIGEYGDIESIYTHCDVIDGRQICFNIWDSVCPQNEGIADHTMSKQLQWADGFILVYSICDRASFAVVEQQVQMIRQARSSSSRRPGAPIIIVGNKRDLRHRRAVSSEEGRLLALAADCGFFEISAAENYHGVSLAFHALLERMMRETRTPKRGSVGIKDIVRSVSAVFGRKRNDAKDTRRTEWCGSSRADCRVGSQDVNGSNKT